MYNKINEVQIEKVQKSPGKEREIKVEIEIGKIKLAEGKNPFLLPSRLYQMRSPQNAYLYVCELQPVC